MRIGKLPIFGVVILAASLAIAQTAVSLPAQMPTMPEPILVSGAIEFVHDPAIIKDGETWYLFSTTAGPNHGGEIPLRCSKDLRMWKECGSVLERIPDWIHKESPLSKNLWAPDISFFDGEYTFITHFPSSDGIHLESACSQTEPWIHRAGNLTGRIVVWC
jgi:beta-xylosidase